MPDVLISIRPEWCGAIFAGVKTIEVRKTAPRLPTPFKCYVYCTEKGHFDITLIDPVRQTSTKRILSGMVSGRFSVKRIDRYTMVGTSTNNMRYMRDAGSGDFYSINFRQMQLSEEEFKNYGNGAALYGWHISDVRCFLDPKPLSEFGLNRPPQSWCYVEAPFYG